jgi:hypothetical protein
MKGFTRSNYFLAHSKPFFFGNGKFPHEKKLFCKAQKKLSQQQIGKKIRFIDFPCFSLRAPPLKKRLA